MSETTAIVNWADKLAGFAQEAAATERAVAGLPVKVKAGQLTVNGQQAAGNKLSVVILGSIYENAYYTADFDSDNPSSPECFAFNRTEEGLAPHADAFKPVHAQCQGCPMNEFGSADKGKGKACKNIRRLAMVSASPLTADDVNNGDMAYMKLPVTSVANWSKYIRMLKDVHKRPPWAVITEIGTVPDPKSQFKVTFAYKGNISDELLGVLEERQRITYDFLAVPYMPPTAPAEEKPAKKGKGKF